MNFKDIKQKMDADSAETNEIPASINDIKISNMPIDKVRRSMKSEIITQLIFIVIFFTFPKLMELGGKEMYEAPLSLYYITIFISSLMTLGYLMKMISFLRNTKSITGNSKEVVKTYIHELKLTLEVYKTAIISGSLLLVVSFFAFFTGFKGTKIFNTEAINIFNDVFFLKLSAQEMLKYIIGYLVMAIFIYFITVLWADKLYGTHIKELKKVLKEFNS